MSELGELVIAAQNKDQDAIEQLYTRYYREIYATAYSYLNDSYAAEDAAQDAFLSVIEHLEQLRDPEVFHSWMKKIVTNRCLSYIRKNGRYSEVPTEDDLMEPSLSTEGGHYTSLVPHEQLDEQETARLMYQMISDLPEKHKAVIYMFYYSEMSVEQIAESLQISPGTVKSRLSYARQNLKKELLALEKQGTKLYNLDTFTDLVRIIRLVSHSYPLTGSYASLMSSLSSTAASAATANAVSAASAHAAGLGMANLAGTSVANSVGNSLALKISLGVSAVTIAAVISVGALNQVIRLPFTPQEDAEEHSFVTETTAVIPDNPVPEVPAGESPWGERPESSRSPLTTNAAPQVSIIYQDREVKVEVPTEVPVEVPGPVQYITIPIVDRSVTHLYYDKETGHSYKLLDNAKEAVLTTYSPPTVPIADEAGDIYAYEYAPKWVLPSYVTETTEDGQSITYTVTEIDEDCLPEAYTTETDSINITFPEHLRTIPDSVCSGYDTVVTVQWGDEVTEIEDNAFNRCSSLKQIGPMSSVTTIGNNAFSYCTSLTDAGDTKQVSKIGYGAYERCTSLTRFTFGSHLQSIGHYAFKESGLQEALLPEGLDNLGGAAFYGSQVKNASFSHKLLRIGPNVFTDCPLETLRIPYLSDSAGTPGIKSSSIRSLLKVPRAEDPEFPNEDSDFDYTRRIGHLILYPVSENAPLDLTITNNYLPVMAAADHVTFEDGFSGKVQLISADSSEAAVRILKNVRRFTFGEGFTSIKDNAFGFSNSRTAPKLAQIDLPQTLTDIGAHAFENCTVLSEVTFPIRLKTIGSYAFANCLNLQTIHFNEGLQTIGDHAFAHNNALTRIVLPESLLSVQAYAFSDCILLKEAEILCSEDAIDPLAFENSPVGEAATETPSAVLTLPEGTQETLTSALLQEALGMHNLSEYTAILLPHSIRTIDPQVPASLPQTIRLIADPHHPYLTQDYYGLYTKYQTTLLRYQPPEDNSTYDLPEETTTIGAYAFSHSLIKSIRFSGNSSLTEIGSHAFESCPNLTGITLPEGLVSLGQQAFSHCTNLKDVSLPSSLTALADGTFEYCGPMELLKIPDSIKTIGEGAFRGSELVSILLPDSIDTIAKNTFADSKLAAIQFPKYLTRIEDSAFENCQCLQAILKDNRYRSYDNDDKFDHSVMISYDFSIRYGLTHIGQRAFFGCSRLETVVLEHYSGDENADQIVVSIGKDAFSHSGVKKIYGAYQPESGLTEEDCFNGTPLQESDPQTWHDMGFGFWDNEYKWFIYSEYSHCFYDEPQDEEDNPWNNEIDDWNGEEEDEEEKVDWGDDWGGEDESMDDFPFDDIDW